MELLIFSVEYFIGGSFVIFWLLLFAVSGKVSLSGIPEYLLIVLLPIIYLWGMLSDFIANKLLLYKIKDRIVQEQYAIHKIKKNQLEGLEARLLIHCPELGKALQMRTTRDRIARAFLVNSFITTILFEVLQWNLRQTVTAKTVGMITIGLAGILITMLAFFMWRRFQRLSARFEMDALRALEEKLKLAKSGRLANQGDDK